MDVLICEDNVEQLYALKQLVLQIAGESHLPLNIYLATTRAQSLLTVVKQQCYQPGALFIFDVLFRSKAVDRLAISANITPKRFIIDNCVLYHALGISVFDVSLLSRRFGLYSQR